MTEAKKVVLTTGASSGIGRATAVELARRGHVSVGSVRSQAKADALAKMAADLGVAVDTVLLDVTDAGGCAAAIDEVVGRHERLDAVVNNAGFGLSKAVEDVDDDEARQLLETMLVAPARLARLALPHLRAGGGGHIVNVSSIYGRTTTPLSGWYQAAKHGLEALSDALRVELAGEGIHVVLIEPGAFKTEIWHDVEAATDDQPPTRYSTAYSRTQRGLQLAEPVMGDPATCARVIAGAIESSGPRARYLVGIDAHLLAAVERLTPTMVKDRVARLVLGL
jgi:NAD(P)-dependent dehydrogenase (short-subunit alcohol dehydrogenase family)